MSPFQKLKRRKWWPSLCWLSPLWGCHEEIFKIISHPITLLSLLWSRFWLRDTPAPAGLRQKPEPLNVCNLNCLQRKQWVSTACTTQCHKIWACALCQVIVLTQTKQCFPLWSFMRPRSLFSSTVLVPQSTSTRPISNDRRHSTSLP